jgi:predicted esterase
MDYQYIKTEKTARYLLCLPDPGIAPVALCMALHGYGDSAKRFAGDLDLLLKSGVALLVPEALSRFYTKGFDGPVGASWMTREDRENEIHDYLTYLDKLKAEVVMRNYSQLPFWVLGFSQGVATAVRWVARGNAGPCNLALWAGTLPPEIKHKEEFSPEKIKKLTYLLGDADKFIAAEKGREQIELLSGAGLNFRFFTYTGEHKIEAKPLAELLSFFK